jgi:uncharacterized protein (TIGR02996 family)
MSRQGYSTSIQAGGKTIPVARSLNDEQAFLKAICDAPNDMAPRLIYCDWLEEEYDRRGPTPLGCICPKQQAANIRYQIASGSVIHERFVDSGQESYRYYRNGFIELLYISPTDWALEADLLTSRHPINQVVFSERPELAFIIRLTRVFLQPKERGISFSFCRENSAVHDENIRPIPGLVAEAEFEIGGWKAKINVGVTDQWDGENRESIGWAMDKAREISKSVDPYKKIWPQITFHTITISSVTAGSINLYPIARYDIYPWSAKPLGDLLQRHAELVLRSQERTNMPERHLRR